MKIRTINGEFQTIDAFITQHPEISEKDLDDCIISYRGREISYKDYSDEYRTFSETMGFNHFNEPFLILNESIRAAAYFCRKAIECLQFARFFTMKSGLLLDTDYNIHWTQGYVPQFFFRCIYFGTSATWFSNAFDHVLQAVYWGKELYTSAKDRDDQPFDDSWDNKKILENCTYEFVIGELKARGLSECRKHLTACSGKIEEVRKWANYIKHKGGIDYKYLEPEVPYKIYYVPTEEHNIKNAFPEHPPAPPKAEYEVKGFKSLIEIDIDEKIPELVTVHSAIFQSINEVIADIDFEKYSAWTGGINGTDEV